MATNNIEFSVFTKPWRTVPVDELAIRMKQIGFDGVEFPLREGYQLEPQHTDKLPALTKRFADHGLKIFSIAGEPDERLFAACAESGIPLIRVMAPIDPQVGYTTALQTLQAKLAEYIPLCEKYGVKIGVQQHYGDFVPDANGLLHLLNGLDPRFVGAVWDAAHDALAGQQPEFGLDIVWERLFMVNFKNVFYRLQSGPEAERAEWARYFTSGPMGLASWPRATRYLNDRGYQGVVCLTAEYTHEVEIDRLIANDIMYARSLFAGN